MRAVVFLRPTVPPPELLDGRTTSATRTLEGECLEAFMRMYCYSPHLSPSPLQEQRHYCGWSAHKHALAIVCSLLSQHGARRVTHLALAVRLASPHTSSLPFANGTARILRMFRDPLANSRLPQSTLRHPESLRPAYRDSRLIRTTHAACCRASTIQRRERGCYDQDTCVLLPLQLRHDQPCLGVSVSTDRGQEPSLGRLKATHRTLAVPGRMTLSLAQIQYSGSFVHLPSLLRDVIQCNQGSGASCVYGVLPCHTAASPSPTPISDLPRRSGLGSLRASVGASLCAPNCPPAGTLTWYSHTAASVRFGHRSLFKGSIIHGDRMFISVSSQVRRCAACETVSATKSSASRAWLPLTHWTFPSSFVALYVLGKLCVHLLLLILGSEACGHD
ncbi:hypothetical protein C8Q76DRAFT_35588 [Earliella scabrosa]|nr:hypothetical protein C8Q76DRAFT_35588 [Earliella scabrosa]